MSCALTIAIAVVLAGSLGFLARRDVRRWRAGGWGWGMNYFFSPNRSIPAFRSEEESARGARLRLAHNAGTHYPEPTANAGGRHVVQPPLSDIGYVFGQLKNTVSPAQAGPSRGGCSPDQIQKIANTQRGVWYGSQGPQREVIGLSLRRHAAAVFSTRLVPLAVSTSSSVLMAMRRTGLRKAAGPVRGSFVRSILRISCTSAAKRSHVRLNHEQCAGELVSSHPSTMGIRAGARK